MAQPRYVTVYPGDVVTFNGVGVSVSAHLPEADGDQQSVMVSINTEELPERYRYDEKTGMRATEAPYAASLIGDDTAVVKYVPDDAVVSLHYRAAGVDPLSAAGQHANALNAQWRESCGMPDVIVFLNDGDAVYDPARDVKVNPYSAEGAESEVSA